ncbi:hypothetical protein [Dictyobacter kobayashii]|uniref:Uncharacterized protein n=1 Tax=Dictyobacter kobayashii TaxID=2014872 RepID=A0A402ABW1_9CHLR|nr:hypothetical protein [Dictyobacter kobayashii]GCE16589.1 hypothetical protein KDK_03890 [Dictyobacter kobayashii]
MEVLIYHDDAFSSIHGKGNPAGVVLSASAEAIAVTITGTATYVRQWYMSVQ